MKTVTEDKHSWGAVTRLLRRLGMARRAVGQALMEAWFPPPEPFCRHGYAKDYCLDDPTCEHFDRGAR